MSLTSPSVTNTFFISTVYPPILPSLTNSIPIRYPINFASVANLNTLVGTYTPANDYLYLFNSLPQAEAPNFMMIFTDGQLNITTVNSTSGPGAPLASMPFNRFGFVSIPSNPTSYLTGAYIEGRTGGLNPMPQGTPVNYTIVYGQAVIS